MAVTIHWPLLSAQEWARLTREFDLSPRQADIIKCLLLGNSDKQIAKELRISVPTVRTHMGRLFQKSGVDDRVELILHIFAVLRQEVAEPSEFG